MVAPSSPDVISRRTREDTNTRRGVSSEAQLSSGLAVWGSGLCAHLKAESLYSSRPREVAGQLELMLVQHFYGCPGHLHDRAQMDGFNAIIQFCMDGCMHNSFSLLDMHEPDRRRRSTSLCRAQSEHLSRRRSSSEINLTVKRHSSSTGSRHDARAYPWSPRLHV